MSRKATRANGTEVADLLSNSFPRKHVDAMLKHFQAGTKEYREGNWEGVGLKAGKFVEAVTKCLMGHCGVVLPTARKFSAGQELNKIGNLTAFSDSIRLVIPRACIFMYDIASNRGGRHDSVDIDANEMDARALVPLMGWTVGEMLRLSNPASSDASGAAAMIESVTQKIYPIFEEIDGRPYVNLDKASAPDVALLLLYFEYPHRINRKDLVEAVARHGHKKKTAEMAVHRLKNLVDDKDGSWQLRGLGREKAEQRLENL